MGIVNRHCKKKDGTHDFEQWWWPEANENNGKRHAGFKEKFSSSSKTCILLPKGS